MKQAAIAKSTAIGALLTPIEQAALWDLAMTAVTPGGLAIEIGTWKGGSAVILGEVCRINRARLLCIDCFDPTVVGAIPFDSVRQNLRGLPITYLMGNSTEVVSLLGDGIADLIFIDGGHYMPVIEQDVVRYMPKLKPTGLYCGHDYTNPFQVREAVDRIIGRNNIALYDSIWVRFPPTGVILG